MNSLIPNIIIIDPIESKLGAILPQAKDAEFDGQIVDSVIRTLFDIVNGFEGYLVKQHNKR